MGTDWNLVTVGWPDCCIGVVVLDHEFRVVALTDSLSKRSGYEMNDLVGNEAIELVHPDDRARAYLAWQLLDRNPSPQGQGLFRMRIRDGYETFGLQMSKVSHDDSLVIMHFNEVSPELRASELSRDLARAIRVLSGESSLDAVAEALQQMVDRPFPGVSISATIFAEDGSQMVFPGSNLSGQVQVRSRWRDPRLLPERVRAAIRHRVTAGPLTDERLGYHDATMQSRVVFPLLEDDGKCLGYLDIVRPWDGTPTHHEWLVYSSVAEVTQAAGMRFRLDAALRWAADHDALTELLNRRGFAEALRESPPTGGVVFVIDLDNFPSINNEFGHATGDRAIAAAGRRLRAVAPTDALLARLGGDEFVGWLPGATLDSANGLAAELRRFLGAGVFAEGRRLALTASVGLVAVERDHRMDKSIQRADAAMYEAKARGGDCSVSEPKQPVFASP